MKFTVLSLVGLVYPILIKVLMQLVVGFGFCLELFN